LIVDSVVVRALQPEVQATRIRRGRYVGRYVGPRRFVARNGGISVPTQLDDRRPQAAIARSPQQSCRRQMASGRPLLPDLMAPQRAELGDDATQSRGQILHHDLGLEPEHLIAEAPEALITPGIGLAASGVVLAVNLDDQRDLGGQEIGHIPAGNRDLAAELDPELFGANGFPDPALGNGACCTEGVSPSGEHRGGDGRAFGARATTHEAPLWPGVRPGDATQRRTRRDTREAAHRGSSRRVARLVRHHRGARAHAGQATERCSSPRVTPRSAVAEARSAPAPIRIGSRPDVSARTSGPSRRRPQRSGGRRQGRGKRAQAAGRARIQAGGHPHITPDPFVADPLNPQGLNRYSYVQNNPLSLTDPTGFQWADPGPGPGYGGGTPSSGGPSGGPAPVAYGAPLGSLYTPIGPGCGVGNTPNPTYPGRNSDTGPGAEYDPYGSAPPSAQSPARPAPAPSMPADSSWGLSNLKYTPTSLPAAESPAPNSQPSTPQGGPPVGPESGSGGPTGGPNGPCGSGVGTPTPQSGQAPTSGSGSPAVIAPYSGTGGAPPTVPWWPGTGGTPYRLPLGLNGQERDFLPYRLTPSPTQRSANPYLPDYFTFNPSVGTPLSFSPSVSVDRYGRFYWAVGAGFNKSPPGVGWSAVPFYKFQADVPSAAELDSLLSGHSVNFGAALGFGGFLSWSPGNGLASGLGAASDQLGGGWSYGWQRLTWGITW
jgi:hypothetical protein